MSQLNHINHAQAGLLLHLRDKVPDSIKISNIRKGFDILGVFYKEPCDEVFGQDAGAAEELLVERVVHRRHVGQSLLLVVPQEGRRTAQTAGTGQRVTAR